MGTMWDGAGREMSQHVPIHRMKADQSGFSLSVIFPLCTQPSGRNVGQPMKCVIKTGSVL